MKLTVNELRSLIREEASGQAFSAALDEILASMQEVDKKIQAAHAYASRPEAKVVLVGMHQDLFQLIHEFRNHLRGIRK